MNNSLQSQFATRQLFALIESPGYNELKTLRRLVKKGADLNARNKQGVLVLNYALMRRETLLAQSMIEQGADPFLADHTSEKVTPFYRAIANCHTHLVALMLSRGAPIEGRDKNGHTPLMVAAMHGSLGVVKILLEHGADANAQTPDGNTPLILAAAEGAIDIVNVLLPKTHKLDHTNRAGQDAISAALSCGFKNIASRTAATISDAIEDRRNMVEYYRKHPPSTHSPTRLIAKIETRKQKK